MQLNGLRKTHPVVLIAAVAVTVFSLLISAAISGLIPGASFLKPILGITVTIDQPVGGKAAVHFMKYPALNQLAMKQVANVKNAPDAAIKNDPTYMPDYKSRVQPSTQISLINEDSGSCTNCGKIVSINMQPESANGYVIRVLMGNGSYRIVRQSGEPNFNVGDEVRLNSRRFTLA